jgi:hypothetical protein
VGKNELVLEERSKKGAIGKGEGVAYGPHFRVVSYARLHAEIN